MKSKASIKPDSALPVTGPSAARPSSTDAPRPLPAFKQVLVPIDFSECSANALDFALALGQKFGTKITLLNVVEPAIYPENYLLAASTLDETNRNLLATGRERLEPFRQRVRAAGLSVETLVRMGRAQSEICDTAKAIGSDLIVMGTHGGVGHTPILLGGTAERVLRHSPCAVMSVRKPGS